MPKDKESQDNPLLELLDRLRRIVASVVVGVTADWSSRKLAPDPLLTRCGFPPVHMTQWHPDTGNLNTHKNSADIIWETS